MNVPQLRFSGFDGEWAHVHLSEIAERVVRKNKDLNSKLPLTISAQHGLVDQTTFFNKSVASANLEGYYLVKKGEFAYNKSYSNGFPLGAIKRLNFYDEGVLSTLYICFTAKENVNPFFLEKYFDTSKWHKEISMISVEGARNHGLLNVGVSDFFETLHFIPNQEEQRKIASFFNLIDQKIDKQKEKIEKLIQFKKGIMQKIFSQALRFKDEDGGEFPEWEVKRLDELGSFYKGTGLSKSHLTPVGKPCILYGELYTKYSSVISKVYSYCDPEAKAFLGEVNDVLIPSSGETAWDIACASALNVAGVALGGDLNVFRPNQQVNGNFISFQINSIKKHELSNLAQGASVVHLYSAALKKLKVSVPVYDEQLRISHYLSELDKKIEKEKEKLMVLEEQKKGIMSRMFV